ncbi:unnamed protein product [Plutella xylostella]|uniref:(diamondback moth) hypothetical protein n=1 Tax=Plutella xylostella TaxID=51655 RepID=A0A8S4FVS8_PLUXY|nr:unnamed protein product [Plutella xylostella]
MDSAAHLQVQCLIGVQCEHFVMIAADQTNIQSVVLVKDGRQDHRRHERRLRRHGQFSQFVIRNLALYRLRNGYPLGTAAAVHFVRRKQAELLGKGAPYQLNLLIGGYCEREGPLLYFVDFLSSSHCLGYAAHGLGGVLCASILDRYYRITMNEKEAYNLLVMCVKEIQKRLMIQLPKFQVSMVNKDGIKCLNPIVQETPVQEFKKIR